MTQSQAQTVWYFAYGSNMSSSTFRGSRGIEPIAEMPAKIPGWCLTFEIYGTPYKEPGFASIRPISMGGEKVTEVHGVAYLVTREQYISILASEGGDIVYNEAELPAEPLNSADAATLLGNSGSMLRVMTLVTGFGCAPARLPSARYKNIMVEGSAESLLPDAYQLYLRQLAFYRAVKDTKTRLGMALFLALWTPLITFAQALAGATGNYDGQGHVPPAVKSIVRCIFFVMWLHHDYLHAPIWGRGDGLDALPAYQ